MTVHISTPEEVEGALDENEIKVLHVSGPFAGMLLVNQMYDPTLEPALLAGEIVIDGRTIPTPPAISRFEPASVPAGIDHVFPVKIIGNHFVYGEDLTVVTINGVPVSNPMIGEKEITFNINPKDYTTGTVAIGVKVGTGPTIVADLSVADVPTPTLDSITPASAAVASLTPGPTSLVLNGTNFIPGVTTVTVGGSPVPTASVNGPTRISLSVDLSSKTAGDVPVVVSNGAGKTATRNFTVTA